MAQDLFNFPATGPQGTGPTGAFSGDVQVFQYTGLAQAFQLWNKPKGVTMVNFYCFSGGGGGGAGFTRTAGTAGGGGGGGASSNAIRTFGIPAFVLPDVLYVQVGNGGLGGRPGVSSGNGGAGANSFVSYSKIAVLPNIVCYSGVNAPGGGGGGAVGAGGTSGTVPTVATNQPIALTWGNQNNQVGLVGAVGGAHTGAAGGNVAATWANYCLSPGAGGGGIATSSDFIGGAVTATANADFGSMGKYNTTIAAAGSTGTIKDGNAGLSLWKPFFQSGGSGGGTSDTTQAGHGGPGGIGSGGGGGGAGATAGNGGNGGPGLVVIVSW